MVKNQKVDEVAHARPTDPFTSHLAARGVEVRKQRDRVLAILSDGRAWTDEEIVAEHQRRSVILGWPRASASGLRSRRSELAKDGLVEPVEDPSARTVLGGHTLRWRLAPRADEPCL
jgi:hypothetical protein